MNTSDPSLALSSNSHLLSWGEKAGVTLLVMGVFTGIITLWGTNLSQASLLGLNLFFWGVGGGIYLFSYYTKFPPGIRNEGIMWRSLTNRGLWGWFVALLLTGFYILYYWWPQHLIHLTKSFNPISEFLRGRASDQWFMYGALYTIAVLVMGFRALLKYRHSRYQVVRTLSVMFFQLIFAFMLPGILASLGQPEKYLNYFWPLSYKDLWPSNVQYMLQHPGALSKFLFLWSVLLTVVATPVLTYYWGKRWYCSWVCGCGGLANTLGDPWRQNSSKKLVAWKIERYSIYTVLLAIVAISVLLWVLPQNTSSHSWLASSQKMYGFFIGSIFAGVVGTGFYPLLGTRVWCRFGCPQAALLGIFQRYFSRFRITTNGAQCISCGNCSTYCEMGIDVRWYAQREQNIVRASCVGCGICSTVCPRGVLNLENGPLKDRINA